MGRPLLFPEIFELACPVWWPFQFRATLPDVFMYCQNTSSVGRYILSWQCIREELKTIAVWNNKKIRWEKKEEMAEKLILNKNDVKLIYIDNQVNLIVKGISQWYKSVWNDHANFDKQNADTRADRVALVSIIFVICQESYLSSNEI